MSNKFLFRSRKLDDAPQNNGVILSLSSSSLFFSFPFFLFLSIQFYFVYLFNVFQYPQIVGTDDITILLSNTLDSLDLLLSRKFLLYLLVIKSFCASLWPSFEVRAMPSFNRFMSCSIEYRYRLIQVRRTMHQWLC